MQLGEMVRNLPEQAAAMFNWEEYGQSLVSALGFDPRNWIKTQEQVMQEQMAQQSQKAGVQAGAAAMQQGAGALMQGVAEQAAPQAGSMLTQQMVQSGMVPGQGGA